MSEAEFAHTVKRAQELACSDVCYAPSTSDVNGLNWANDEIGQLRAEVERLALSAADSQRQADLLLEKLHTVETERNRYKAALEWIVNNSTDEEPFAAATRALAEAVRP